MKLFTISGQLCMKTFPKLKMALDAVLLNTRDLNIEFFRHFPRTANVKKSRD